MLEITPFAHTATHPKTRFGLPRVLIIGCGDVGMRIVSRLRGRFRLIALTTSTQRVAQLRAAGVHAIVGNLDRRHTLTRLAGLARYVIYLAPPPNHGSTDTRLMHWLHTLKQPGARLVYVSTTGVYGNHEGRWINEATPALPMTERAIRRRTAELMCRVWQQRARGDERRVSVLRVPGIYAQDRLPLERLRAGTPVLTPEEDVYTNHIHADDLARIIIMALFRGRAARIVNAVDDTQVKMGEYFDQVADRFGLSRPPRMTRAQLSKVLTPTRLSFMSESRRIGNHRLKRELRVRLNYPTVSDALKTFSALTSNPSLP